jgi:hypothetical protein
MPTLVASPPLGLAESEVKIAATIRDESSSILDRWHPLSQQRLTGDKTMTSEQAERFEASLRATHGRIDRRLNRVHEQLDKEETYSLSDTLFGKLLGQRDELANASDDLALLRSEFELFKQGVL